MLKSHFEAVERYLLALKQIGKNTGHNLHKGNSREAFIREFLIGHLSEKVSIGTGEIIDKNSLPGEKRNQHDIVIFKVEYPRIDFGGEVCGFLAESVVATIEVKSTLTKDELAKAISAAKNTKNLNISQYPSMRCGWIPPAPLSFVVAYDGPVKMKTVHGWIDEIYNDESMEYPQMSNTSEERNKISSPAIDGIFILGKGFILFDNCPVSFIQEEVRMSEDNKDKKWCVIDIEHGAVLMLFLILTRAVSAVNHTIFDASAYSSSFKVNSENINFL